MVKAGTAFCVAGNHDVKLVRWLRGKQVKVKHGLEQSIAEVESLAADDRGKIASFLDGLVSHYVLDGGRLVVAHAGLREEMHGRGSAAVREFCLYGETTGETDEFGLPVRYNWASEYRGKATVVYGHTPVPEPEWLNNTVNIDTGAVFGGKLTALRYPEREFVSMPQLANTPLRSSLSSRRAGRRAQSAGSRRRARSGRRHRQAIHRDAASSNSHDPRGELDCSAGGDEPVCNGSTLDHLSAADDVPQ